MDTLGGQRESPLSSTYICPHAHDSHRFEEGGPTLSWHVCQQLLFDADGDVLLLLDCCNAASIAKGVKEAGRLEMIAACAKNNKTVAPSSASFTRILIKELKPCADSGIFADHLADKIRQNDRITGTTISLARTVRVTSKCREHH